MTAGGGRQVSDLARLLQLAARAVDTAIAHHVQGPEQGEKLITGAGGCAACAYVNSIPAGNAACRASREGAAARALSQNRPVHFVCHMGFACLTFPAPRGEDETVTIGPYVPPEGAQALAADALAGLQHLESIPSDDLPFPLDDIPPRRPQAVSAAAEWLLANLSLSGKSPAPIVAVERSVTKSGESHGFPTAIPDRRAAALALAVAANDRPLARKLAGEALAESRVSRGGGLSAARGRALALAGAVLEHSPPNALTRDKAPALLVSFAEALAKAGDERQVLDALLQCLWQLARRKAKEPPSPTAKVDWPDLNKLLRGRLVDPPSLTEAAGSLDITPSAVTHRLKRNYGMNWSEYLGRLRVIEAKRLLRETKLSVRQVSLRVGIADQSNFARLFRRFEGDSPGNYRDRFGQKE